MGVLIKYESLGRSMWVTQVFPTFIIDKNPPYIIYTFVGEILFYLRSLAMIVSKLWPMKAPAAHWVLPLPVCWVHTKLVHSGQLSIDG